MARVAGVVTVAICLSANAASAARRAPLHWSAATHVGHNGIDALSCPSTQLCVAGSGDGLLVSTKPSGGAQAWSLVLAPPAPTNQAPEVISASCPSSTFCAAVTTNGDLLTSTNPAGGTSAWKLTRLGIPVGSPPHTFSPEISCSSAALCVVISRGSKVAFSSSNPAGGAVMWKKVQLGHPLLAVACTGGRLCLLGDDHGDVRTSRNPTGGARTWSFAHIFGRPGGLSDMGPLACGSPRYCLVGAVENLLIVATNPTATRPMTPGGWQDQVAFAGNHIFLSGSCASTFCAFTATGGYVYYPTKSFRTLTRARVDPGSAVSGGTISCATRRWCALGDGAGNVFIGTR